MSDSSAYQPPITQKVSSIRNFHGDSFEDSYEWLRQKESPEVLTYLRAENDFCEKQTAQQDPLRKTIFEEIKGRVQETDLSVPTRHGNWWYFSRTVEGQQYPLMCRVAAESADDTMAQFTPPRIEPDQKLAGEQIILDCNAWAEPLPFFSLGSFSPSLDGKLLTFGIDDSGDERFTQYFKNLETGEVSEEKIENIFAGAFLTADGESLIYSVVDDSWRPYEARRHKIGAGHEDTVLFHESDQSIWLEVSLSADRTHVLLTSYSSEFSEVRIIPVTDFSAAPQLIISKDERVQYSVEPLSIDGVTHLLILHDYEALNSEIVLAPLPEQSSLAEYRNTWLPVLAHQDNVRIESLGLTRNHLVVTARQDTTLKVLLSPLEQLTHLKNSGSPVHFVEPAGFTEEIYTAEVSHNSVDSPVVRISYTSWVTPERIYDYFPESEQLELRRETPVLGGYSPQDYTAYRLWAPARDGKLIPLSVIHRADLNQNLQNPVLQYGYGSYEASMDPSFSVARLSLLDRGVVFVVAHVRGGGELGRGWYQAGKKLHKKNTFFDFVDSTDFLVTLDWIDEKRIAIHGGSAGGLLVGAVLNLAPEKYCAAIADVPFVDALTTILNPDLPLSALEWEEWGNPLQDRETYNYMKSYTPYENIQNTVYPPIVAVTSLNDTRVYYVEPAKWVAKLRETISPLSPPPLLKIEMDGGHGGGSGRYTRWREVAWEYAFFLTHLIDSRNER